MMVNIGWKGKILKIGGMIRRCFSLVLPDLPSSLGRAAGDTGAKL